MRLSRRLRDDLAKAAMQAFLTHPEKHNHSKHKGSPAGLGIAIDAYSMAEYMLEARRMAAKRRRLTLLSTLRTRVPTIFWVGLLTFFIGWVLAPLVAGLLTGWRT